MKKITRADQPKDAVCANCRHHRWRMETVGPGVTIYYSCWKHNWESVLKPGTLESAIKDASIYCCTLWTRSWRSRWEKVKKWLSR